MSRTFCEESCRKLKISVVYALFNTLTLSVAAGAKETATWNSIEYMQEMTTDICNSAPLNSPITLTDSRDGNTYTVTKIQNKTNTTALCWMTQNLRLVGNRRLTSEDSDVTAEFLLPPSSSISNTDDPKQFSSADTVVAKVYYENNILYGAYYNWFTATAGTGTTSVIGSIAKSSLCPRGWRLPTGDGGGEYYSLLNGLTGADIVKTPYNFVYSGGIINSELSNASSYGFYWTSKGGDKNNAYRLYFYGDTISSTGYTSRYAGYSVRCVAR